MTQCRGPCLCSPLIFRGAIGELAFHGRGCETESKDGGGGIKMRRQFIKQPDRNEQKKKHGYSTP